MGRGQSKESLSRALAPRTFAVVLSSVVWNVGCSGDQEVAKTPDDPRVRRSTAIVLEQCPIEGDSVVKLDANGDDKPEVWRLVKNGREVCRVADLNFDGRPDRTTFFDEAGKIRRIETDFDRDHRVDEIALYRDGVIVERHRATSLSGKLDTWEFYEAGKIVRTERDENGDGIIDQWWEYPHEQCPLIHSDADGDGRPDPAATIDYCKATGFVPPLPPGVSEDETSTKSPTFQGSGTVTEVSNLTEEEAAAAEEEAKAKKAAGDTP